jgi:hypothetical protein
MRAHIGCDQATRRLAGSTELIMPSKFPPPPQIDSATIDFYLARGRRERARALAAMLRSIFSPGGRRSAEVHELPARERGAAAPATRRRAA